MRSLRSHRHIGAFAPMTTTTVAASTTPTTMQINASSWQNMQQALAAPKATGPMLPALFGPPAVAPTLGDQQQQSGAPMTQSSLPGGSIALFGYQIPVIALGVGGLGLVGLAYLALK